MYSQAHPTPNSRRSSLAHVHRPPVPGTCMSGSNCPVTTRGTACLMYLQSTRDRVFMPKAYNTRQRATPQLSLAPFEENGQQFERPVDPRSAIVGGLCPVLRQAFGRAVPNFLVGPHGMWSCYHIEVLSHSRRCHGQRRTLAGRTWRCFDQFHVDSSRCLQSIAKAA